MADALFWKDFAGNWQAWSSFTTAISSGAASFVPAAFARRIILDGSFALEIPADVCTHTHTHTHTYSDVNKPQIYSKVFRNCGAVNWSCICCRSCGIKRREWIIFRANSADKLNISCWLLINSSALSTSGQSWNWHNSIKLIIFKVVQNKRFSSWWTSWFERGNWFEFFSWHFCRWMALLFNSELIEKKLIFGIALVLNQMWWCDDILVGI